jgi:hypothetical protein
MKRTLILGIAALLSAVPAVAATQTVQLLPPDGSPHRAWGLAQTVDRGQGEELFQVRADVAFRNGTKVVVAIELEDRDGVRDWYDVAVMEVRLGTASMVLDSRKDFSTAFPVAAILRVQVKRGGVPFLIGSLEDSVD